MKESFKKTVVRSRLKWAGHVAGMGDEKWQRDQMPSGEKRREEDDNAMGCLR